MSENNEIEIEGIALGCMYPAEVKGFISAELYKDRRHIIVKTETPIKGHKPDRKIRIDTQFNLDKFRKMLVDLSQYSNGHITDRVKKITGKTPTQLRHILATDQLMKTQDMKGVSNALGHNSKKNAMYYVDYELVEKLLGLKETETLIRKTEHGHTYSMMKIAVKSVMLEIFSDINLS